MKVFHTQEKSLYFLSFALSALFFAAHAHAQEKTAEVDKIFSWTSPSEPGCAVAVSQHGDLVLNRAYGSADLERDVPISPDTIFDAGSLTKQFVAAAALLLVEEGKIALSDDIRRHIPELTDYGHTIKVDHLLTHTAGVGTVNVNTGGTVSVDGGTFLGDPNGGTGTLHMGGGTFDGDFEINVLAGSTINGTGTINADVMNSGNILPSGGTGLTFNGILSNATNNINGNKIHFGANGGYVGSGLCLADITGNPAAAITATGPLTIGANTTSGFSYLGTLDVGSHSVTLVDSNQAVLGGETLLDGGTLSCNTGIGNQNGAAISGKGTLAGNVVNSGIIEPTDPGDSPVDISINGNLLHNPTSEVLIELNGPGNSDRINVTGTVTFGGTAALTLGPDYLPSIGEQIILVNAAGGRTGTFASIDHSLLCDQYTIVLVYSSTAAIALIRPSVAVTSVGDVDRDGDQDLDDFSRWLPCMAGPDVLTPPAGCNSDDFQFRDDLDGPACEDYDVDLKDFWVLQRILG